MDNAFTYMECYKAGEVGAHGDEPPLKSVLEGRDVWTLNPKPDQFLTPANARKIISALSFLHEQQCTLLNDRPFHSLRSFPTLKAWEENLKRADIPTRLKQDLSCPYSVTHLGAFLERIVNSNEQFCAPTVPWKSRQNRARTGLWTVVMRQHAIVQ